MKKYICLLILTFLFVPVRAAEEKYVALTFDDGPSGMYTRRLLDGLEERESAATFFLCGYRLEEYPGLAKEILDGGHEIGIHGYSHRPMSAMDSQTLESELTRTEEILLEQTGQIAVLMRPPGGSSSAAVRQAAQAHDLALVTWSIDPRDWATSSTETIVRKVVQKAADGDIILLHDMSNSSVDAALGIVDRLKAEGFRFVTVSQLAAIREQTPEAGYLYTSFP